MATLGAAIQTSSRVLMGDFTCRAACKSPKCAMKHTGKGAFSQDSGDTLGCSLDRVDRLDQLQLGRGGVFEFEIGERLLRFARRQLTALHENGDNASQSANRE